MTERLTEAFELAARLHREQKRKGTEIPYLSHLMAVAALVQENGGDEDQVIAALLHDGPEDQGGEATLSEIRERFGDRVASIVAECSDTFEEPKPPWKARKQSYLNHLESASEDTLLVSLADKVHNLGCIARDYRNHGDDLWSRFKTGRDGTLWYYGELLRVYEERRTQRFAHLIDDLRRTLNELTELVQVTDQEDSDRSDRKAARAQSGIFDYYDDWKSETLTCSKCGWKGTFEEGSVDYHSELMDSSCPHCGLHNILAIVNYPTHEETKDNWEQLSDEEKDSWERRDEFITRFENESLKSPDQLPDIDEERIHLVWDTVGGWTNAVTHIRHGSHVLWKEPAVYEGAGRFAEILKILEHKYGPRLVDLEPVGASGIMLNGDSLSNIGWIRRMREELRARSVAAEDPTEDKARDN